MDHRSFRRAHSSADAPNNAPLLADDDPIGVSVNFDRPANGAGADRVFVIVKANQAGLRHGSRQSVKSIEPAAIGNELRPLLLEHLPNGVLGTFRMWMSLGIGDDLIGEPSIQPVIDGKVRFANLALEDVIETIRLSDPAHADALHHRYCNFWLVDGALELNAPTFGPAHPRTRQRRKPANAG